MAKGNRGGKRSSIGNNSKYNGFSITDVNGETENYIVVDGVVKYADLRKYDNFMGYTDLDTIQQAYDTFGGTQGVIDRINSVGKKKASVLSDKRVKQLQDDYKKVHEESEKILDNPRKKKKGVNRHRTHWSAM